MPYIFANISLAILHGPTLNTKYSPNFQALARARLLTSEQLPLLASVVDARLPSYPTITDKWLACLGSLFTNLTRLDLSNCLECTDEGSNGLTALQHLKTLNVDRCLRLGDASLQSFACLPRLCSLSVSSCTRMASAGVACLSSLIRMTDLNLEQLSRLDSDGLAALSRLTNLRSLNLGWTQTTDESLRVAQQFRLLKRLNLSACLATDEGFEFVCSLSNLESLELMSTRGGSPASLVRASRCCRGSSFAYQAL